MNKYFLLKNFLRILINFCLQIFFFFSFFGKINIIKKIKKEKIKEKKNRRIKWIKLNNYKRELTKVIF
jgi:hypothetical protein